MIKPLLNYPTTIFNDLYSLLSIETLEDIPSVEMLNQLAEHSAEFKKLGYQFVAQDEVFDWQDQYYEQVIAQRKLIPTRLDSWHDFFNACIWLLFPQTKHLLSQLHLADITQYGLKKRTKQRDAITLFDECGVILCYQNEEDKIGLRSHLWHQCFWSNREAWHQTIIPIMFGHANYEMALKPYIGLTGKAYFVKVGKSFNLLSKAEQYAFIDQELTLQIGQYSTLKDNFFLSPIPFLGIPTWYPEADNESFYHNQDYFRPKRQSAKAS
ncbi:DUF3025 domain-containing protein [Catenovulum sp. SM1970]|uniref:DUF3025 domain-containing protein n=1 Tax=Marinifaba aquimaris TaxID=2741323 RepID=UPI001572F2D2|nr:DUF3025 domain-containing protein [Marinifaba aquimaris]NTS77858.1 DUF3025 domain-containing protein [Marinifaba aquimaris]